MADTDAGPVQSKDDGPVEDEAGESRGGAGDQGSEDGQNGDEDQGDSGDQND